MYKHCMAKVSKIVVMNRFLMVKPEKMDIKTVRRKLDMKVLTTEITSEAVQTAFWKEKRHRNC